MDRLEVMHLFTRIVERQSFTLAALDMDIPRSTATQAIKALEKRLGVRLLQRTTRHVRATLDGEAYHRRCLAILAEVEEADAVFTDARPRGQLRIDVHGVMARHFLMPALPSFLADYPDLQLHIGEGDRLVDLVREGVDCVLGAGRLHDSAMVGRQVCVLDEVTVASPAYLERHGVPLGIDDLEGHQVVGFVSTATGSIMPLEFTIDRAVREIRLPATVTVVGAETYAAACELGLGLAQMPRYHVAAALAAGSLVEVLPRFPPSPTPVSVLYPHSRQLSPRVRVFIDWITKRFVSL